MKHSRLLQAAAAGVIGALILAPAAAFAHQDATQYVGMGDSYASGHGAGDYDDSDCHRSANAYGPLLAEKLPAQLNFVACSGATIPDVTAKQLPALSADTGLVTIAIGGNDVGFVDIITTCTTSSDDTCISRVEEAEELGRTQVAGDLATLYADMAAAAPNADTVVAGYPKLFAEQECAGALGISVTEQQRINSGVVTLNGIIAEQAAAQGFTFADAVPTFEGHGICSDDDYIKGLNTDGAYHPNATGQSAGYLPAVEAAL